MNTGFAQRLSSIAKKNNPMFFNNFTNQTDRLNDSGFIIDIHDYNQDRIGPDGRFQSFQIDQPISLNRQITHFSTQFFQMITSIQYSPVFSRNSNHMFSLAGKHFVNPFNGKIYGFGSARSKNN